MNNSFNDLKDRFSALGFQCVIRSNYPNDGSLEVYAPLNNDALLASIHFEQPKNNAPYIQFVYNPTCLGSELKSMPLYQRENDIDRTVKEYQTFNNMIRILSENDY